MDQNLRDLIEQLGEAIHESVSESSQIASVVQEIRRQGYDVLLMLEATIGLNEVESQAEIETEDASEDSEPFTQHDLNFLKSLRISFKDETES